MIIQESHSSYLFNFETKVLEKPMNLSPACLFKESMVAKQQIFSAGIDILAVVNQS